MASGATNRLRILLWDATDVPWDDDKSTFNLRRIHLARLDVEVINVRRCPGSTFLSHSSVHLIFKSSSIYSLPTLQVSFLSIQLYLFDVLCSFMH